MASEEEQQCGGEGRSVPFGRACAGRPGARNTAPCKPVDIRRFGMAKEGLIARQLMLGMVQTADSLPIHYAVFAGNTAEASTLYTLLERVPGVRRLIMVVDRGLLSLDNLEELSSITLASGQPREFILAVPGRRYTEFADLMKPFHQEAWRNATPQIGSAPSCWRTRYDVTVR